MKSAERAAACMSASNVRRGCVRARFESQSFALKSNQVAIRISLGATGSTLTRRQLVSNGTVSSLNRTKSRRISNRSRRNQVLGFRTLEYAVLRPSARTGGQVDRFRVWPVSQK